MAQAQEAYICSLQGKVSVKGRGCEQVIFERPVACCGYISVMLNKPIAKLTDKSHGTQSLSLARLFTLQILSSASAHHKVLSEVLPAKVHRRELGKAAGKSMSGCQDQGCLSQSQCFCVCYYQNDHIHLSLFRDLLPLSTTIAFTCPIPSPDGLIDL